MSFNCTHCFLGKIGFTANVKWSEPKSNRTEDIEAAQRKMMMEVGNYFSLLNKKFYLYCICSTVGLLIQFTLLLETFPPL